MGWIVCLSFPPRKDVEVLTASTLECDLIREQGLCRCNQVKMKSWQWILIQYDRCPYEKQKSAHTNRGSPRVDYVNWCRENAVRRWDLCCHKPRNVWGHQKLEGARKDPSTTSVRESLPLLTPDLRPLASISVRQWVSFVRSHQLVVFCYGTSRKRTHWEWPVCSVCPCFSGAPALGYKYAEVPSLPQIHLHFCLSPALHHPYLLPWGCFESRISSRREEQPRQLESSGKEASGVLLGGGGSVLPPNRSGKAVLVRKRIRLEIPRILCDSLIALSPLFPKTLLSAFA